jgi:anti-sigma regulatory factor (Ser/Thr protein kinase)
MHRHVTIPITEVSQIGEARRAGARLGEGLGLNSTDGGRVSIVVTELATNLVRHTGAGGELLLSSHDCGGERALEILAIDAGPGMTDVDRCLKDGFSTGGTAGNGLGAVLRLSDESDVYSSSVGTVVWCRIIADAPVEKRPRRPSAVGVVSTPAPGETICGDAWRAARSAETISLLVVDGLGHGPLAAEAAEGAAELFDKNPHDAPRAQIEAAHARISGTRGAAMAVARIDLRAGKLTFAGVGNISGSLLDNGPSRGLVSHNGIVGHQMRKVQEFEYPWQSQSMLIMHSDGLQTRWSLGKFPGLAQRRPAVIAGLLYRDFKRGNDDATVVVVAARQGVNA